MRSISSLYSNFKNQYRSRKIAKLDWRTNRHIVVLESDDWGSIRMSNKSDWNKLLQKGYSVDKRPYERYDTLESDEDLLALYQVLEKHKDSSGHHPVITANMLVANPDFQRIKEADYQEYFFEPIMETYKRYYGDSKVLEIMREGMDNGLFMPQSHGREHFNVRDWMSALRAKDPDVLAAFEYGMCGIAPKDHPERGNCMMVALKTVDEVSQKEVNEIVSEGLDLFERLWGWRSETFIAPCYRWNEDIEKVLSDGGVKLLQSSRCSRSGWSVDRLYHYSGQRNMYGQIYSIRNSWFEPANASGDEVGRALSQVSRIFSSQKVASISTHRINYVGGLSEKNRTKNLIMLDDFLNRIIKMYPDVEFLSSNRLIELYGAE